MLRVLSFLLVVYQVQGLIDLTVETALGPVVGQRASDGNYTGFFGIRYASINESNPFGMHLDAPKIDSSTPFNASDPNTKCPHYSDGVFVGILDCLRLNVYVPNSANSSNLVPVYVWVHGGGFETGSAGMYGGQFLVEQDIVVVTINYRLGPFGFLCLDDATVPGNQGLKDQAAALQWVHANIAKFGGDPNKVTLGGQSGGAGSVDLHLYSSYELLFQRVILESGCHHVKGQFVPPDHNAANTLTGRMGYNATNTTDALNYLIKSNYVDVATAFNNSGLLLRPCQEKVFPGVQAFVTTDPYHMKAERVKDVGYLIGYNSREEFFAYADRPESYFASIPNFVYDYINVLYDIDNLQELANTIQRFYMKYKKISRDALLEIIDFGADFMANRAVEKVVDKIFDQGAPSIYKYIFSYVGGSPYVNYTGVGASHMDELNYLFKLDSFSFFNDELVLIKDRMVTMWGNFIKYGNPTPEVTDLLPVQWVPMTNLSHRLYFNIDVNMSMNDSIFNERVELWNLWDAAYWTHSRLILNNTSSST